MSTNQPPTTAALLIFPESSASVVYGMYDLFMSVGRDWGVFTGSAPGPQLMQPRIVAAQAGALAVANGVRIVPETTLATGPVPDLVCVPDLNVMPGESLAGRFETEIAWLRHCYAAGAVIGTACSGALLLAQAGLLDGCDATTHWAYCEDLRRAHPTVKVCPQRALVVSGDEQRLVMAGGGTTWLDLAVYLVARLIGVDAAMQVARIYLINWHDIGPQPYARLARSRQSEDRVIGACQEWIAANYREHSPVNAMVKLSGLADRSFNRRFQQATGLSALQYVHTLRIEEAKQMLESGDEPVESIASEVGYEDAGFFNRLFQRNVGLTPAQYRRRFGAMRRAIQRP
ncbi:MAG: GlxA family transcriptional regulator [Steroidobacteraceae bacterium]